jgi:uncharacterized C2H2 Zn-finger protein
VPKVPAASAPARAESHWRGAPQRSTLVVVREDEHDSRVGAVWAECPRCAIPFELDRLGETLYYLVCPCCGMTRMSV